MKRRIKYLVIIVLVFGLLVIPMTIRALDAASHLMAYISIRTSPATGPCEASYIILRNTGCGYYLMMMKRNQRQLYDDLALFFEIPPVPADQEQWDSITTLNHLLT